MVAIEGDKMRPSKNGIFVTPWDEASKSILEQMFKKGKAFTSDIELPRAFGRRYPELINDDFLTIARTERKHKTVFVPNDNVLVFPMSTPTSRNDKKIYKFHKVF
jgi:hypothetical protein